MAEHRCPQCSAAVAVDESHCSQCGYPLEWQGADDDTDPPASQMVRRPGEVATDQETQAVGPLPPATQSDAPSEVRPPVWCPACGAANPAGRTLCERCGMGLDVGDETVRNGPPWWRGRIVRGLALAIIVVGGVVAGLLIFSNRDAGESTAGGDGGAAAADGVSEAPSQSASEPAVLLEPGATGEDVQQWQQLLVAAGLDVGVDSQFGPTTERETATFQRTVGEEPTGKVTTRTLAAAEGAASLKRVRIFLVRDGALDRVRRRVDEAQLARGALEMLIAAPLQVERDDGLSSAIPRGTAVRSVRVEGRIAEVALTGFAADPQEDSLQRRVEQVVATATQFDSINEVRLLLPPEDAAVFSDAGVVLTSSDGGDG
ncbi:hypothetical protein BH23ACT10_BH23ACT10_37990 [soil metagenome]